MCRDEREKGHQPALPWCGRFEGKLEQTLFQLGSGARSMMQAYEGQPREQISFGVVRMGRAPKRCFDQAARIDLIAVVWGN